MLYDKNDTDYVFANLRGAISNEGVRVYNFARYHSYYGDAMTAVVCWVGIMKYMAVSAFLAVTGVVLAYALDNDVLEDEFLFVACVDFHISIVSAAMTITYLMLENHENGRFLHNGSGADHISVGAEHKYMNSTHLYGNDTFDNFTTVAGIELVID